MPDFVHVTYLMSIPISRGTGTTHDRTWIESGSFWLKITPFGFRKILNFIKDEYGNPPIYVTENGISERGEVDLNDLHRKHYYENYINQALKGNIANKRQVYVCCIYIYKSISISMFFMYMHVTCSHCCSFSPCSGWGWSERLYSLVINGQLWVGRRLLWAIWTFLCEPLQPHISTHPQNVSFSLRLHHYLQWLPRPDPWAPWVFEPWTWR